MFAPPEDISGAVEEQFATLPWDVPLEEGMRSAKVTAPRAQPRPSGIGSAACRG
ncbi:MAG: hypothetical protein M5U09_18825 [Gammaproteobacteria bacterium]|nr:hypothetical protein [Gammaproteobacteria bacterium]